MKLKGIITLIFLLMLATSCQKESIEKLNEDTTKTVTAEPTGILEVNNVWVRVAAKGRNTAMFLDILNGTGEADTLISAESNAAVLVEIHETYKRENDMMGMRQVEQVIIPSLQQISLKPRGLHVMLITLNNDIQIGDTIKTTLNFASAGRIDVTGIAKEMDMRKMK